MRALFLILTKSVNNEAHVIDVAPLNYVPPSHVAENVIDSDDISSRGDIVGEVKRLRKYLKVTGKKKQATGLSFKESYHKHQKASPQASKVSCDASNPLNVGSDLDNQEFPSAKELKEFTDCHFVVAYDKNPLVLNMRAEIETLQGHVDRLHNIDSLKRDQATVMSKVVPDVAMKLIRSNEMGFLVTKLVKAAMFQGRCIAFEKVVCLKRPFILEKMPGYHSSLKVEFDRASDGLSNASYPFLVEVIVDPYAPVEKLLLKKPQSLRSKHASSCSRPSSSKALVM
nr:hypothetical protein [Tanacetum cinerariifolium]